MTSAAEALDNERLHGLIFAEPARSASPDWGRGALRPLGRDAPEAYRVRGGGIVVPAHATFDEVMLVRFGDPIGRIEPAREIA